MEKVTSVEHFYELHNAAKAKHGKMVTNCYLGEPGIKRYLDMDRLFYVEVESGIVFLSDEEEYYKAYYYLNADKDFTFNKLEKPVLFRNLYVVGKKKENLLKIEDKLKNNGFVLHSATYEYTVSPDQKERLEKLYNMFSRVLKKGNFVLRDVLPEEIDDVMRLRGLTKEFDCFTFPYLSMEEEKNNAKNGDHIAVFDADNKMCACAYIETTGKTSVGNGLAVLDDYKTSYGFGALLMYKLIVECFDRGCTKYLGWVVRDDEASIKFHESLGIVHTGREEEDWVL